jgi:hypothetical protein
VAAGADVPPPAPAPARDARATWFADDRGIERRLKVSWHPERKLFVLSVWDRDTCTATFRLPVGEAPRLISALAHALGQAATSARTWAAARGPGRHRRQP